MAKKKTRTYPTESFKRCHCEPAYVDDDPTQIDKNTRPLEALTEAQGHYILSLKSNAITFALGPAGTGKTFVAGVFAIDELLAKRIERIIITRPKTTVDEDWGEMPGTLIEKYAPYLGPFWHVFNKRLGKSHLENLMKPGRERIQALPLGFMRGETFENAIVILDEAQNTTPEQMKMFLTRLGRGARLIIDGDESQKDIQGPSGLTDAVGRIRHLKSVGVVKFEKSDIVRHDLVQDIIEAYQR
ncbi:PhoH family protein [Methylocaldum szegediense]|uniref:PhoH family protein n=1 Tax=Methylocaldum szegediense TaxID=73780 RepID=UPI00042042C9|nr:PhoH family protein [Methylocaldum szegediense]